MDDNAIRRRESKRKEPLCYKLEISFDLHWFNILDISKEKRKEFGTLSDLGLANTILWDSDIWSINEGRFLPEESLFSMGKKAERYLYTMFKDENSGLVQIWSEGEKSFVDDIEITKNVFGERFTGLNNEDSRAIGDIFVNKYGVQRKIEELMSSLIINPTEIGFQTNYSTGFRLTDKEKLSQIPTWDIVKTFHQLRVMWGDANQLIKKFPQEIQEKMEEQDIKYDTLNISDDEELEVDKLSVKELKKIGVELYDRSVDWWHIFRAPHYSVYLSIKYFDKWDKN